MAFEWPVFTRELLGGGHSWSATFESYDQYRELFYFRVQTFRGDNPAEEFVAQIGSEFAGDDWTSPEFHAALRSRLADAAARKAGIPRLVVVR